MKHLLLTLSVLVACLAATAKETRTIVVNAETLGSNPSTIAPTKQFLQMEQDGITITSYSGIAPSTNNPRYFYLAANWMTATSKPPFIAVTSNKSQFNITGVDVKATSGTTSAYYKYAVATTTSTPELDENSTTNLLNTDDWVNDFVSTTGISAGTKHHNLTTPAPYACFYNAGMQMSYIYEVVFYYEYDETAQNTEKVTPDFAFEQSEYSVNSGETIMPNLITTLPAGADIKYEVSPANGLVYDADNKTFNANIPGEYTVTASFVGDDTYNFAATSCKVTVVGKEGEKQMPMLEFVLDELELPANFTMINLRDYLDMSSDLSASLLTFSFTPEGDSPADGVRVTGGYLVPNADGGVGVYTVTVSYAGDDKYYPASASIPVQVGEPIVSPMLLGTVYPAKTNPTEGMKIPCFNPVSQITLTYPVMGDDEIDAVERADNLYIKIMKDGQLYKQISTADRHAFYISSNNYSEVNVRFEPISEVGRYTLVFPANILTFGLQTSAVGGTDITAGKTQDELYQMSHNAELRLSFDIIYSPTYTVTPAPGSVKADELKQVVFTYPEGTTLKKNPDSMATIVSPSLYYFDTTIIDGEEETDEDGNGTGVTRWQKTQLSTYNVSFDANKVILTLAYPEAVVPTATSNAVKWDYIAIPAGYWIASYEGADYPVVGTNLEKYSVIDESLGNIGNDEAPYLTIGEYAPVTYNDLAVLKVKYPEGYKFNAYTDTNVMGKKIGYPVGSLRRVEDAEATQGTNISSYTLAEVDEENRELILEISEGSLDMMSDGIYCVQLTTNLFVLPDKTKSGFIYFKGFRFDKKSTGVEAVETESCDVKWYDIHGVQVSAPVNGLYIRVKDGKAEKVIVK